MERSLCQEPENGEFEGFALRMHLGPPFSLLKIRLDISFFSLFDISNRYVRVAGVGGGQAGGVAGICRG